MNERDPQFPNIERPAALLPFLAGLRVLQATRPDLMETWRRSVEHILPEMTALLQKRNDTPEQITPADAARMLELTTEVQRSLSGLLSGDSK